MLSSLIPISDSVPTRRTPVVTVGLILANLVMFFRTPDFGQGLSSAVYFVRNAPVPCQLPDSCPAAVQFGEGATVAIPDRGIGSFLVAVLVSTFLHAGWAHILGNMLFLWIYGNNIEDNLGHVRYLVFYLLGGIAAGLAHAVTHIDSPVPAVGASGAVAAVMGAYLLVYPRARINVLVFLGFFITVVQVSAFTVLAVWFVFQLFTGVQEATGAVSVAWMAHVGGFVFGVAVMYLLGGRPQKPHQVWHPAWRY